MILKDTATFQVLFIVSLFCARNITTLAFAYLKVKSAKCLCFTSGGLGLVILVLVLVLRIWSFLHHWTRYEICPAPCKWWLEQPPRAFSLEVITHQSPIGHCLDVPVKYTSCVRYNLSFWPGNRLTFWSLNKVTGHPLHTCQLSASYPLPFST